MRRPAQMALLASLPLALAGCEYLTRDIPTGWNLVLAVCIFAAAWPIYAFLRELLANLLPEITFRRFLIISALVFVALLIWLRILASRVPPTF